MDEEKIVIDVEVDASGKARSGTDQLVAGILKLTEANRDLQKQMDSLDKTTKEGTDQYVKLKQQQDANTDSIKNQQREYDKLRKSASANIDSLKGQAREQDNLKKSTGVLVDTLKGVSPATSAGIEGFKGMTSASLKFIATPIGAVIAALAAIFFTLKEALGASEESMDAFEDVTSAVSAVIEVLQRRAGLLLEALIAFAKGDWSGAADKFSQATSDLTKEIEDNINATLELNSAQRDLEDAMNATAIASNKASLEIAKLNLQAKNRTLSEEQRIKILNQAVDKEKEVLAQEKKNAEENLRIVANRLGKEKGMLQQLGESTEDYSERIVKSGKLSQENAEAILEAFNKVYAARLQEVQVTEKANNLIDKLEDAKAAKAAKRAEARAKQQDDFFKALEKQVDDEYAQDKKVRDQRAKEEDEFFKQLESDVDYEYNYEKKTRDQALKDDQDRKKKEDEINKAQTEQAKKNAEAEKKINDAKNEAIIGGIDLITKKHSEARTFLTALFRADAIKEMTINTYDAAIAAYKAMAGIPYVGPALGAAAAAVVAGFGAAQIAGVLGITFARGGSPTAGKRGLTGGKPHSQGGTKFYGTDGSMVELERGENWYVLNRAASAQVNALSALNVRHGGVDFSVPTNYAMAGGVIATQTQTQAFVSAQEIKELITEGLKSVTIVTYIEDVRAADAKQNQIQSRAQVV